MKEITPLNIESTNLQVKESAQQLVKDACKEAGIGLVQYVETIKRGLTAKKMTVDKYGEEHWEEDTTNQLKSAMLGLEIEGYIKNKAEFTGEVNFNLALVIQEARQRIVQPRHTEN